MTNSEEKSKKEAYFAYSDFKNSPCPGLMIEGVNISSDTLFNSYKEGQEKHCTLQPALAENEGIKILARCKYDPSPSEYKKCPIYKKNNA